MFCLYEAECEYFDISDPAHVTHDSIVIGHAQTLPAGYFVGNGCIGCKLCYSVCPQKCIDIKQKPVSIDQHRCPALRALRRNLPQTDHCEKGLTPNPHKTLLRLI